MNRKRYMPLLLSVLLISSAFACKEEHADRELQSNVTVRFTNPDGTIHISGDVVLDNLTGLIWLKADNCIGINYPSLQSDGLVSYKNAIDFIAGLNKGKYLKCSSGYSDWRLPTPKELRSLLTSESSSISAWVGRRTLANIQADRYWSSGSWYYDYVHPYLKVNGCYVWPVRAGDRKRYNNILKSNKKQQQ